ncbi:PQQ-dependent catabolism-associated CXXCW motif protein [Pseudomonas sp. MAFF212428]|uniref:PQQ-dependent catabolism-associated CXXCW motif protein n=1 Tax=Pseudomonas brassicae TaxID=2708063 RepID=A0A6B3NS23_9PSED|nr:PQQ-dependent catabolism-associated CXXCW motif protein [Pseudomonas brassicae]NER58847.1 PQQ-dependent catabolism-associated CXXCW motif protein [Pseudomonas brassicae]NER63218.1 PQQ-dependent catabolism-associated CXXCW motif protein [Pseudomonas brassicae]
MLLRALLALACLLLANTASADTPLFGADGYRIALYRSPTPDHAPSASTVDTPQLQALLEQQPAPLLIDVYKRPWLHARFIDSEPHANLPGSHWLANTGDGELDSAWAGYFSRHLQRLSNGDKQRALVFYCRSDCWLSWNAVKRANALGYTRLYWYRDGLDAWEAAGLPVHPAAPEAFP